ncbi:phospholipase [Roseospira marina]|uniref:Phospholipase n=1 Tax=Roseospira marina TaxID=140057 RepID=A0A5M6IF35_9PROT|nr:dienelactone hydrolase family protein [Roseospira marina]KAA5606890.1 phospholipase [Roseospira marina]MBB4312939.1 phospholipase/carboxylesterase [Roseospira marina]MBB5086288.1 phospholipase/carboxylesterase [Roseospira marina]
MTDAPPPTLDGPSARPASGGVPRQLVVLLHGYGADGNDLIALAPHLAADLPDAVFHAPHAPDACEVMPFGRQWFSFTQYDPEMWRRDAANLVPALDMMGAGADSVAPALNATLDALLAQYGLGADALALVGFSQGTMMALHVALRRATPMAAVVGFSGALPGASALPGAVTARPPITLIHGKQDPVVPFAAMAHAQSALAEAGLTVDTHARPGLEHGIDDAGITIARETLRRAFS